MKRTIAIGALLATICGLVYYLALPAMTFTNAGFWWYVLLCLVCAATTLSVYYFCEDEGWIPMLVAWITTGVFFVAFVICAIISWRAFQWKNAQAIAQVEEAQVSIQEVFDDLATSNAVDELPLIDYDTAKMLSDKQIAGLNHAEWYDVDDQCNLINYQGKYYRISLVDYGELFKFGKAKKTGLPGYVLVDVTPVEGKVTQSANLVKLEESVQYSPGAFWSHDLRRHLRGQYVSYVFDESHIEIDDEGTPYWITGVMRPTGGVWGARSITSVILTNAQTGDSQEYRLEELPEWVDSAFSIGYLMKIAEWHYALRDGWWNASFSQTNVWRTSYYYRDSKRNSSDSEAGKFANFFGYSMIVVDGDVKIYTGLTAANNAESNLGWLVIDASTGKMTQYAAVGAEESSAQAQVEQLVQAQRYEATFPIPANIGGYNSYLMCLKGKAGTVQGYAICNMENYSVAVVADTLNQAIDDYLAKLGKKVDEQPEPENEPVVTVEAAGIIEAIYTAEISGTTNFYYVVDGTLYRAKITIDEQQVLFNIGDTIEFEFISDGGDVLEITKIARK